uniref:XLF-like N-terminal domain-containing protein n=1 Tax=Lotharella oceanica TaxID=641309 RepID=A0A7S2U1A1_9EUKA
MAAISRDGDPRELYVKAECTSSSFSVLVTDVMSVWRCIRSGSEIEDDREKYVPRLRGDGDNSQLLKKTLELVNNTLYDPESKHNTEEDPASGKLVIRSEMKVSYFVFNWEFHFERLGSMATQRLFIKRHFVSALTTAIKEQQFMLKYSRSSLASSSVENRRAVFSTFGDTYALRSAMEDVNRSISDRQVRPSPATPADALSEPVDDDLFGDDFDAAPLGGGFDDDAKHASVSGDVAASGSAGGGASAAAAAAAVAAGDVPPPDEDVRPPPKKKRRKKKKKFV